MSLPRINPINPAKIASPFNHEDWVFELKHDGFRAVACIEDANCRLMSRKQIQYKSFVGLASDLAKLPVKSAILDGELVVLDQNGRSQFLELMRRKRRDACFYAWDLLWHDGEDLHPLPLIERKRRLRRLIKGHTGVPFADQIQGSGIELFQAICARDLEGVVAKHRLGPYEATPVTWLKVLNPDYSQKRGRREMFEKFHEQRPERAV
jgi:bifunctional non-homologous end joining protein LigD